jgi:hypothetical protein
MELYHGSTVVVSRLRIIVPNRALDFGAGFYCTSDIDQAKRWAHRLCRRVRRFSPDAKALVSIYEFDDAQSVILSNKKFPFSNKEWLDFVASHRLLQGDTEQYDLIIGPVANDDTFQVIQDYTNAPNKELYAPVALDRIKASNLKDQYVFKSEKALGLLSFVEAREVG